MQIANKVSGLAVSKVRCYQSSEVLLLLRHLDTSTHPSWPVAVELLSLPPHRGSSCPVPSEHPHKNSIEDINN